MTSLKVCLPFCAALVCSAFSTGFAAVEPVTKGYQLSPLEAYLIETFAEEQVRTFINTGNSTLFDHPKVFYVRSGSLARELKSSPKSFQKKYLDQFVVLNSIINEVNGNHHQCKTIVSNPYMEITYTLSKEADHKRVSEITQGLRNGFYCKVSSVENPVIKLSDCIPIAQYKEIKMKEIEAGIRHFLSGKPSVDPNMPTYAMLAYTAVVSAKLLPKDSVCRETVSEEVSYTSAEMRLCNQEVSRLWENAGVNPRFDETMDSVQEQFQKDGIDTKLLSQAAGSLD